MTRRIVFVLPSYQVGGSQRVLLTLFQNIDRRIFDPHLIIFEGEGALKEMVGGLSGVHILSRPRLRGAMVSLLGKLRELRPDVVFSTLGYVNLALLGLRVFMVDRPRIVIRESNTPSQSISTLKYSALLRLGYRWLYRGADAVICQSAVMASELAEDFGVGIKKIHLIVNPVDVVGLRRSATPLLREPGEGRRFVAAGHLIRQKGYDRLLEIFSSFDKKDHLTIYGDGIERASLQAQINNLDIAGQVSLPGFVDNPWPGYAGADAFLMPSRWEGLPNAALEALACGTPVIATPQTGGLIEIENKETDGKLIFADIEEEFSAAMLTVPSFAAKKLRRSILPDRFQMDNVNEDFVRVLLGEDAR